MTVATAVEVRSSGVAEPGPILRTAWSLGRSATAVEGKGSATPPGAQSFRSNWQAQLASLGSGGSEVDIAQKSAELESSAPEPDAGNLAVERPAFNGVLPPPLRLPEVRQPGSLETNSIASYGLIQPGPTTGIVSVEQPGSAARIKEIVTRQSGPVARPERPNKVEKEKPDSAAQPVASIPGTHDFVLPAVPVTVGGVAVPSTPVHETPVLRHSPELFTALAKTFSANSGASGIEVQSAQTNALPPRAIAQQASDARPDSSTELPSSSTSKDANSADDLKNAIAAPTGESAPRMEAPIAAAEPSLVLNPEAGPISSTVSQLSPQAVPVQGAEDVRLAGGNSALPVTTRRATREVVTAMPAGHGGVATPVQFTALPGDAMGLLHDPQGALRGDAGSVTGTGNGTAAPALRETFSALDAEAAPGAPALTHATGRQVEAGFQDPALGWIGVRADLSGGGVHASLVPDSVASAQELGRHMDGINNYLAEQHTPVASLGMAAPNGRGADASGGDGFGQGTQQGSQQGSQQGTDQNAQQYVNAERQPDRTISREDSDKVVPAVNPGSRVEVGNSTYGASGAHISVMA
jgi:hypothetical protein